MSDVWIQKWIKQTTKSCLWHVSMTTTIAITIMLVVPILGTGGSVSLPPTCALFILADNTQNVKILIIQKRNWEIIQKRGKKKKKTVERGWRPLAQYNSGVSSSSQVIFLSINLLCLHRKLANCDVGGFFFFFECHWRCGSARQSYGQLVLVGWRGLGDGGRWCSSEVKHYSEFSRWK